MFLAEALEDEPSGTVFASVLVRTQLTAEPLAIARGFEITVLPGLHEVQTGELESRADRQSVRTYLETVFAWGSGNLDARIPGGENGHDFFAGFDADIATIEASDVASSTTPES